MKTMLLIALMIFCAGLMSKFSPTLAMIMIVVFMGVIVLFMGKDE